MLNKNKKEEPQRETPRRHLIFYLRVYNSDTGDLIGFLGDISTKGIMVVSETPVVTDKVYNLSLHLNPSNDRRKERILRFDARSIWSKNDINPDFYDTGFEYVNKKDDVVEEIQKLIEDVGFNDHL